jgi:hypothetical protein
MGDFMFVAVDIDTPLARTQGIPDQPFTMGVSTLDTRALLDFSTKSPTAPQLDLAIRSYQFKIGPCSSDEEDAEEFLFGSNEEMPVSNIRQIIQFLVHGRDYITVGHSAASGLEFLRHLQVDGKLLYSIDTMEAARRPLRLHYRYNLPKFLNLLQISLPRTTCAGNNAHLILQALLMIAAKDAVQIRPRSSQFPYLQHFKAIAQTHRPLTIAVERVFQYRKLKEQLKLEGQRFVGRIGPRSTARRRTECRTPTPPPSPRPAKRLCTRTIS